MKRLWKGISIAVALSLILGTIAYAYSFYIDYQVKETSGTSYTMLPVYGVANNSNYAATGMISATGLNTRVYDADNSTAPHMLTTDKTWFAIPVPGNNTKIVRYGLGVSPALTAFKIIAGYSGNITVADNSTIELGNQFDLNIAGYFQSSASPILYKAGAASLTYSGGTLTFHALNAGDSDNWTVAAAMGSGSRRVRVYADGFNARLYIDDVNVATHAITATATSSAWTAATDIYAGAANKLMGYANGIYWRFYEVSGGGGPIAYRYTATYSGNWSTQQVAEADFTDPNSGFGCYIDGTHVHLAWTRNSDNKFAWKRGTLNADGSITWDATVSPTNAHAHISILVVDSTDHDYISYDAAGFGYGNIIKNANTDGTWATAGGYPQAVSLTIGSAAWLPRLSVFNGNYLLFWNVNQNAPFDARGKVWNGAGWSAEEIIGNGYAWSNYMLGDCYDGAGREYLEMKDSTNHLYLNVRGVGGGWNTPVLVRNGTVSTGDLSYSASLGKVIIWYAYSTGGSSHYFYKVYDVNTQTLDATEYDAGGTEVNEATGGSATPYDYGGSAHLFSAPCSSKNSYVAYIFENWSWNDNANGWVWMAGNSMAYADNMTLDTSAIRRLTFKPTAIISGTTLIDESGNGQNGTFNWGGIPAGVLVTPIAYGTGATPSIPRQPRGFVMPAFPIPQSWFNVGKDLSGLPFYDSFAAVSAQTGQPVQVMYFLLILGLAFGAFLIAVMFTRLAIFGVVCFNLVMFFGSQQGVVPSWMIFAIGIIQVAILYLYKQVAY